MHGLILFVHSYCMYHTTHNIIVMITFSDNVELHIIVALKLHAINSFPNSRCVRTIIFHLTPAKYSK